MSSIAVQNLQKRLKDVAELISAHEALTGGNRGRPAEKQGAAITKAGIIMLTAVFEAFIEDVFERAAKDIFVAELDSAQKRKDFFRDTSQRLNSANVKNINFLYAQIGYPFILNDLSWKGFDNANLRTSLDAMVHSTKQNCTWRHSKSQLAEFTSMETNDRVICRTIRAPCTPTLKRMDQDRTRLEYRSGIALENVPSMFYIDHRTSTGSIPCLTKPHSPTSSRLHNLPRRPSCLCLPLRPPRKSRSTMLRLWRRKPNQRCLRASLRTARDCHSGSTRTSPRPARSTITLLPSRSDLPNESHGSNAHKCRRNASVIAG